MADSGPISVETEAATSAGDRHLEFFAREAALSRDSATAIDNDDADPGAFGVPGRTIIAEGDSWFDYSALGDDIIDHLRNRHRCRIIRNFARYGDTLENMVYGTAVDESFRRRVPAIEETIALVGEFKPRAFVFSGGGNDIAGSEFAAFLNHREESDEPLRGWYVDRMFDVQMPAMYERLVRRVLDASPDTHIYTHGYGNAIPSGVPAVFALWTFGPWLRPSLAGKGWTDLVRGREIVRTLIGRFNTMLAGVQRRFPENFHYVDLRPVIDDRDWENELHLSDEGYGKCAAEMYRVIEGTAPGWPR